MELWQKPSQMTARAISSVHFCQHQNNCRVLTANVKKGAMNLSPFSNDIPTVEAAINVPSPRPVASAYYVFLANEIRIMAVTIFPPGRAFLVLVYCLCRRPRPNALTSVYLYPAEASQRLPWVQHGCFMIDLTRATIACDTGIDKVTCHADKAGIRATLLYGPLSHVQQRGAPLLESG